MKNKILDDPIPSKSKLSKEYMGKCTWETMNGFAFGFPEFPTFEDVYWATQFYQSIGHLFPCKSCQTHYLEMFNQSFPFTNCNQQTLSQWVVQIHNQVNQRLGKPIVPYDEIQSMYQPFCSSCQSIPNDQQLPTQVQDPQPQENLAIVKFSKFAWFIFLIVLIGILMVIFSLCFLVLKNFSNERNFLLYKIFEHL